MFLAVLAAVAVAPRRQLLALSISDAPHSHSLEYAVQITEPRFSKYAEQVGASVRLLKSAAEVPTPANVVAAWGRVNISSTNNTAYVLKMLAVYDALEHHDEVLLLDDTVSRSRIQTSDSCASNHDARSAPCAAGLHQGVGSRHL